MFYIFGKVIHIEYRILMILNNLNILGHNKVNQRLRGEEISNDPAWPKVPFPSKEQCNSCVRQVDENDDALEYDENETYNYLKNYYNLKNISSKKGGAMKQLYNYSLLLFSLMLFVAL